MAYQGEIIDGKYEILREIGRGGMSVVYLAMDKRLNKQWAIKEFRKDKDDESKKVALKALLDEANLMKKLDHPTLPRIVDIIDNSKTVYIVMDYIEGESLNKVLDAYGAQPQEAVIEWAKQLSEVLDYLHTRVPPVIYRDMKPANIMLKPDGTIRLIDFGIAREYKEGKDGDTTSIGTRGYAAPEQFGDKGQTDARTDIYSLGVTLYHLVTGKNPAEPPYEIYPIRHWNPNLSSGLEWLIQKCTQLNPKDRYQSCAEVTYVLENLEKFESAYKGKQKRKINLFITSVALTLVFGIIGGSTLLLGSKDHDEQINVYMNKGTIEGYEEAIDYDEDYIDAYFKLANKLSSQVKVIYPEDANLTGSSSELITQGIIRDKDILTYFSTDRLEKIKNEDISKYVRVNYELGRLYWNYYKTDENDDSSTGSILSGTYAETYFKQVIDNTYDRTDRCGLSDYEYNMVVYSYLLSYFKTRENKLAKSEDNSFRCEDDKDTLEKTGFVQISDNDVIENPYNVYWNVNMQLILNLDKDEVTDIVKLNTLNIVINTVDRNLNKFLTSGTVGIISASETEKFFNTAVEEYELLKNSFSDSDTEINTKLQKADTSLKTLREDIQNFYDKNGIEINLATLE
jgi:serine/threonine-protein kinase